MQRYYPHRNFPPYSFIPTLNLNPNSVGDYREGIPDPISTVLDSGNFSTHKDYLFAIDLINFGYYWESHVYFEAIWHAHHRKGDTANYCKALVKIAAGAIKQKQGRKESAKRLFDGSLEILNSLPIDFNLGISLSELKLIAQDWMIHGQKEITIKI